MNFGIRNKRVLITGASRGIGASIAEFFAMEECQLSLIARNESNLKKVIQKLNGNKSLHDYIADDLRRPNAPTMVAKKLISKHNNIDIVIHNLGGGLGIKDPIAKVND